MNFAIIVPASAGYLPGLNAIANAIDYYHFENTALEILNFDIDEDYICSIQKTFGYPIHSQFIMGMLQPPLHPRLDKITNIKYSRWIYATQIAHKYDAIAMLGADCAICDNYEPWFRLVARSPMALTASNVLGSQAFPKDAPIHHTNMIPFTDIPFICNPSQFSNVFLSVTDLGIEHKLGDMPALWFALRKHYKLENVIRLPDNQWLFNHWYLTSVRESNDCNGRKSLWNSVRERIYLFHKKWWIPSWKETCKRGLSEEVQSVTERHGNIFYDWYKWFNSQWKHPYDY